MSQYLVALQAFLLWLLLSLGFTGIFALLYMWITPQHELQLIRDGNTSAAVCLGGTVLGYVLPLASAMVHGADLYDFMIWALIAMLVQLAVYLVLRLALRGLTASIVGNRISIAILVAFVSLATGILNAAAMFE
ncbi:MAG: DUF350 domain-containing protein [Nevskia sp.]